MERYLNSVDDNFIKVWHPKYDETENDEPEYLRLIRIVKSETISTGTITQKTFEDILNWKAARVKGRINWNNIFDYLETIKLSIKVENIDKLQLLVGLEGIGVPVGSTILHFLFPESFPIIDYRTVEVLNQFGYIHFKSRSLKSYPAFRETILLIKQRFPWRSLREIDRALFAFHKQFLEKKAQKNCEGNFKI